ncbi:hypothetical protein BGX31_004910 [Mortierella sp. GBA43]|nr:hypothetical protein BGX31_004910 [Mortierella sp. GBA43]
MRSPMTVVPADASRLSSQEPSLTSKTRTKFAIPSCIVPTHKSRGGLDYAHRHKQPSEKDLVHKPSQKPMDVEENGGGDDDDGDDEDTELKLEPRIDCDTTVDDATDGRPEDGKRGWEHMEKRDDATKGNKQMLAKQGTFAKDMAKLERWITKAVERQSVRHEAKLRKVFSNILRNEEAPQHLQALKKLAWQQSRPQRGLIQNVIPVNPGADKMLGPPQINTSIGNDGGNNDQNILLILLDSLLQPFILQTRADIRNIVIWLCAGAPGSKIDGRINGSDEFSSKALQEDVMAIFHPNGSHSLGDIIDPRIVPMVLGCLKSRLQDFVSQLDTLLWERLGQGKEFLLQRVAALTGVPRFLIPLSEEPRKDEGPSLMGQSVDQEHQLLVESQQELPSEYKGRDDIQSQMEALGWVVDTVINELKSLAVDDALPKSKIKKGASSRIGSRQRANSARQQQGHHHHREMGAERQRLQIPWAQDGPTKPHEDKNVGMCGWIQDRLG